MSKKSILIVEKDLSLRTVLTLAIEDEGHHVMSTDSFIEAMNYISVTNQGIDILFYHLPEDEKFALVKIKSACLRKFKFSPKIISPILKQSTSGLINLKDLHGFLDRAVS